MALSRREFVALMLAAGVTAAVSRSYGKELKWVCNYDFLKKGAIIVVHTLGDNPEKYWYCAFLMRDSEKKWYNADDAWTVYGRPATLALARELNLSDSEVEAEKKNFIKCAGGWIDV